MTTQELIAARQEARATVAEELRLELWKLPAKVAERLEAYEARFAAVLTQVAGPVSVPPQAAPEAPKPPKARTAKPGKTATVADADAEDTASKSDEAEGSDLADDLDDGAPLF